MKVAELSFGVMNAALALNMTRYGHRGDEDFQVMFWDPDPAIREFFEAHHTHSSPLLQELEMSNQISPANSLEELCDEANHLILGPPAQKMRSAARSIAQLVEKHTIITIVSKGIELGTYMRMSEVVLHELRNVHGKRYRHPIVAFSGGTTAVDLAYGVPVGAEVASRSALARESVQQLLNNQVLRVWRNPDIKGVEYAGALKNVISMGAGMASGLVKFLVKEPSWWKEKYPDVQFGKAGIKSVFISRAEKDLYAIARALGGKIATYLAGSIAFHGDIMLSCFGTTRNLWYGHEFTQPGATAATVNQKAQNLKITVEGRYTVKAVYELAQRLREQRKLDCETPCIDAIYGVVWEDLNPIEALEQLMAREKTDIGWRKRGLRAINVYFGR